jgi:hypothetical protein
VFALRSTPGPLLAVFALAFCNHGKKATATQCDTLIERYAELVVREQFPDASPQEIAIERDREKSAAHGDDAFKCTAVIEASSYECAMRATTPDGLEHCLE